MRSLAVTTSGTAPLKFAALEITRRCTLTCPSMCCAETGPTRGHGAMTTLDWRSVITDLATLGAVKIQLIGGEPTSRPDFPELLNHVLNTGLQVEIYSNLFAIKDSWWDLFTRPGVCLATSYHSDGPGEHDRITGRRGSHARTRRNIVEAVARSIPIRAGAVQVLDGQRLTEAGRDLRALGVHRVEDVWPCVLGRWLVGGNVKRASLSTIVTGPDLRSVCAQIPPQSPTAVCNPDCKPSQGNGSDCAPAETDTCPPSFCNPDE